MKLTCICMFKNEAALMGPFLDQVCTFFDHVILLDHGSTDPGAAMVAERQDARLELLQLKASGYPQQQVATGLAERLLARDAPDFLFFLDCDEFLPFADRAELEAMLEGHRGAEAITIRWQNICPMSLDGGDIFRGGFAHRGTPSDIGKIILSGEMAKRRGWVIPHGYHTVVPASGESIRIEADLATLLYHIPIQSRLQFRFKIAAGSRTLRRGGDRKGSDDFWHWHYYDDRAVLALRDPAILRDIALNYGDPEPHAPVAEEVPVEFPFPYVRSAYDENGRTLGGQLEGLLQLYDRPTAPAEGDGFVVADAAGELVLSDGPAPAPPGGPARGPVTMPQGIFEGTMGEHYAALVEPLFNLPTKIPPTAWIGHIPFLFALFRALRPGRYVELGVHNGASLIAAATAAATYQLPTSLTGVDTWQGDEHAGMYDGEPIYRELLDYTRRHFRGVRLQRSLFDDARQLFMPGSIDILHIDGLHTYDAVKHDFTTWFDLVSPQGVILFHDTEVLENGFGVHRLWSELKQHFHTLEFRHSFGLGVVFLAPEDPAVAPFMAVARNPKALAAYQSLVADIAGLLPDRMKALHHGELTQRMAEKQHEAEELQRSADAARRDLEEKRREVEAMHRMVEDKQRAIEDKQREIEEKRREIGDLRMSTSWRVTRPLRALRRLLGR